MPEKTADELLVDAFSTGGAIDAFNQRAWASESQRREASRTAAQERDDLLRDQAHAADLLDES